MSIILDGSPASEGIGSGRVFVLDWGVPVVPHEKLEEADAPDEVERFHEAKRDNAFNTPEYIAAQLLEIAFDPERVEEEVGIRL